MEAWAALYDHPLLSRPLLHVPDPGAVLAPDGSRRPWQDVAAEVLNDWTLLD